MKAIVFMGSPRINGNTHLLSWAWFEAFKEAGGQAEFVPLAQRKITPCLECGGCDETGECILEDDMTEIYTQLAEADTIVLASPIFFYNITSFTQALVERSQACWVGKYRLGRPLGSKGRTGIFLSLGATKGKRLFEGPQRTIRYFFDAIDATYVGGLFYRGIEARGAIKEHPRALTEVRALAKAVAQGLPVESWPLINDPCP